MVELRHRKPQLPHNPRLIPQCLHQRIQGGPFAPEIFFKIMQFWGNFGGKTPILRKCWALGPPGIKTTGPPWRKSWICLWPACGSVFFWFFLLISLLCKWGMGICKMNFAWSQLSYVSSSDVVMVGCFPTVPCKNRFQGKLKCLTIFVSQ